MVQVYLLIVQTVRCIYLVLTFDQQDQFILFQNFLKTRGQETNTFGDIFFYVYITFHIEKCLSF